MTIEDYFKQKDKKIYLLVRKYGVIPVKGTDDHTGYFAKLCREIIGQQLSGYAAGAIVSRFNKLFKNETPEAQKILQLEDQDLRDAGMAWSKVRAIKNLAELASEGKIPYEEFCKMSDLEVIESLVQVKGIGQWTAEMFLIFTLGRKDVFSIGDLGLRKAVVRLYNLRVTKTLNERILKLSRRWSPYRSYASLLLWKSIDEE
ncbi:MAG: DNA-3-methyladenine glycosylase 2 family protein [Candidatus Dojkabacteria bacterium]|jgi:DNA-3-methyladenine glycosylase II|nr:DNA-3-methyladenine glycosylase 2 family protein [Candidatus Dojkabacteria bacterium]